MCEEMKELISSYIDGQLSEADEKKLLSHLDKCGDCQSYYNELNAMVKDLNSLEQFPLPENFHKEAMAKIRSISKQSTSKRFFIPLVKYTSVAAGFLFLLTAFTVAGSFIVGTDDNSAENMASSQQEALSAQDYTQEGTAADVAGFSAITAGLADLGVDDANDQAVYIAADETSNDKEASTQSRLLLADDVKESEASLLMSSAYYIEIESEQFDTAIEIVNGLNASIINSGIHYYTNDNRSANFSLNIPVADTDTSLSIVRSLGKVVNESNSSGILRQQYDDAYVSISVKEQERLRLLNLMEKTTSMGNLLLIEGRLSQVEAELGNLNGILNSYMQKTGNPTFNIVINEKSQPVILYENKMFTDRIRDGFIKSINSTGAFFENLLVFVAGAIVPLCILILFGTFGFLAYRRKKKKGA